MKYGLVHCFFIKRIRMKKRKKRTDNKFGPRRIKTEREIE